MHPAVKIANIFVNKGIKEGIPVTQMQLQKLVYFANGILLAQTDGEKRLVEETFEAWDFGPVIPTIYHEFKQFGAKPINPENDILRIIGKERVFKDIQLEDPLEKKVVDETWDKLKNIDGIQLSNWTHRDKSAWTNVYQKGVHGLKLREEDIINDFGPLLTKNKKAEANVEQ